MRKQQRVLAFQAVGEHPRAADAAGIPVHKYQYIAMLVNGILGGIGGAYLVLVQLGVFTENMISGRGYIALAAVILGRYTPVGTFGAALIFGGPMPYRFDCRPSAYRCRPRRWQCCLTLLH